MSSANDTRSEKRGRSGPSECVLAGNYEPACFSARSPTKGSLNISC